MARSAHKAEIKRAPAKISRFVGCRYWRASPPRGGTAAQVAAHQKKLFDAVKKDDAETACSLLMAGMAGEVGCLSGDRRADIIDALDRLLRPYAAAAGPNAGLIPAVPGGEGAAYACVWFDPQQHGNDGVYEPPGLKIAIAWLEVQPGQWRVWGIG